MTEKLLDDFNRGNSQKAGGKGVTERVRRDSSADYINASLVYDSLHLSNCHRGGFGLPGPGIVIFFIPKPEP